MIGEVDGSLFAARESSVPAVAGRLAVDFGEYLLPVRGERTNPVDEATTVDGRNAWVAGYDVSPADPTADGGTVHAVVIEDGGRLVYALIVAEADPAVLEQARAAVDSIRFA
ncbi:hypothetical protein BJF78_19895 [Pseudonocardia sp. CNS-139]|nr:hypothetical protein BJF78_19895 [Pseudonocardia sp. CNS-139]